MHEALKKRRRLDDQNEVGFTFESQLLHTRGNAPCPGTQFGAIYFHKFASHRVLVDNGQRPGHIATTFFGDVTELLTVDGQHGFHVVQQGITFRLLIKATGTPALAIVINLALSRDVVLVQKVHFGGCHEPHGLREGLDCVVGEGAFGHFPKNLEMPALEVIFHIRKGSHRKSHAGFFAFQDFGMDRRDEIHNTPTCFLWRNGFRAGWGFLFVRVH